MPAIASLQELQLVQLTLQFMKASNSAFFDKLQLLLFKVERYNIPHGYVCQRLSDVEIKETYLNKIRKPNKRLEIDSEIFRLKSEHYTNVQYLSSFLKSNCMVGYKNICRMILGDTPETLKGGKCG